MKFFCNVFYYNFSHFIWPQTRLIGAKAVRRNHGTLQKLGWGGEGANRAKPESRAKREKERGSGGTRDGSVSPSPENIWNFELQIVQ